MTDVQDVQQFADEIEKAAHELGAAAMRAVRKAVVAEREWCAQVCDAHAASTTSMETVATAKSLAARIRKGGSMPNWNALRNWNALHMDNLERRIKELESGVAAERERCAKIADDHWEMNQEPTRKSPGWDSACLLIAEAIRKGE